MAWNIQTESTEIVYDVAYGFRIGILLKQSSLS